MPVMAWQEVSWRQNFTVDLEEEDMEGAYMVKGKRFKPCHQAISVPSDRRLWIQIIMPVILIDTALHSDFRKGARAKPNLYSLYGYYSHAF